MTSPQGLLQLFIGLTAIASIFIGVSGYIGHLRLGDVAGQAVLVSPYFAAVVIFCGVVLYIARLIPRYARPCAILAVGALLFALLAPRWSEAWSNGRGLSANLTSILIFTGAAAAFWLQRGHRYPPARINISEVPIALLGLAASTFISYVLVEDNIRTRQTLAERSAEVVAANVGDRTTRASMLIQRLTERWNSLNAVPERSFMDEGFKGYLRDFPFFLSLHLIDDAGEVVLERSSDPARLERMEIRRDMVGLLDQVQAAGVTRFIINGDTDTKLGVLISPLRSPAMMNWSVIASVDLSHIATWAMARGHDGGYFRISHGGETLYQSAAEPPAKPIAAGNISIPVHDDFALNLYYAYTPTETDLGTEVWAEFIWLVGVMVTYLLIVSQRLTLVARQRAEQLSHNALHDPLTGLPNRRQLEQRLREACAQARHDAQNISVMFIDLDGIKLINDSVGHDIGDEVLIEASRRLQQCARNDAAVNQLGDTEFVLLLRHATAKQAQERSEELIAEVASPYQIAGRVLSMTANVGIVSSDGRVNDPMELVRQADLAMLEAKRKGQNSWHTYTGDLSTEVAERLQLLHDLQIAIDNKALELHYQPIVEGCHGRVVGIEGLLRWNHQSLGYVSPARFIPLAEESGHIVALTDWVLATACRDCAMLRKQGLTTFPIAVNISPLYFQRDDFIERVQDALDTANLPPQCLELEITEGVLVDNEKAAIDKLSQLQAMGIRTAIDDFGTGYSSLSYLKNLPIDKVKIDRSFVTDVVTDPAGAAIVQGIISMAHHLSLAVVAEGVETEPQYSFLKHSKCGAFQGYLFSRPKPFHELMHHLDQGGGHLCPQPPSLDNPA